MGRSNQQLGQVRKWATCDVHKKSNKKTHRPCLFCLKMQAKLPRHLKLVHKDEPEVIKAVSLPSKQSNQEFERLKKLGIYKYNKEMVKQGQTSFIRERQQGDCHDLQMCCYCKGFFAKKYIYRHISTCSSKGEEAEGGVPIVPVIPVANIKRNSSF